MTNDVPYRSQVIHNYEESVFLKKVEIYKEEVKRKEAEASVLIYKTCCHPNLHLQYFQARLIFDFLMRPCSWSWKGRRELA